MILAYILIYSYVLWLMFLAVMALKAKWSSLPITVRILAAPSVLIAVMLDIAFNWTIGAALFLRLPDYSRHEYTFSQRVGNYKRRVDWRAPIAVWICANLLDPFDVGGHCK
jgi:hypothetical protein